MPQHMDVRVVKERVLRTLVAIRVGSNPTPCIFLRHSTLLSFPYEMFLYFLYFAFYELFRSARV